jgi:hypothetical protein
VLKIEVLSVEAIQNENTKSIVLTKERINKNKNRGFTRLSITKKDQ